jgi:hypothetical protein
MPVNDSTSTMAGHQTDEKGLTIMGMDVYGNKPIGETGEYFRANVWWWRPLANYCCTIAPEITGRCECWQSNDGDGLGAADAFALAECLQTEINSGRTATYERIHRSEQEALPNEPCWLCKGTGSRAPMAYIQDDDPFYDMLGPPPPQQVGPNGRVKCNCCNGEGFVRPASTNYPFSAEFVAKFVAFLRECGGFRIC